MAENQVYLIKSGQNSFVEETNAIIGIDNAGRVGIGTTAPDADFHVTGDTQIDGNLTVKGNLTTVDSTTIQVDDKNIELGVGSTTDAAADGGGITLHGDGTKTFNWVDATDAWTSSEHLHLAAGKRFSADAIRALGAGGLSVGDDAGNGIFIEDGGSVGIGTATPAYDLDVDGSGRFSNSLYVGAYKVYTTNDGSWKWQDSGDDIYYTAGKVGVANDSPAYNLHVSGDAAVDGNFIVNGTSGNFNVEELNVSGDYVHVNYLSDDLASDRGGLQVHSANGTGKLEYLSDTNHWQFNKKLEVLGDIDVEDNLTIGGNLTVNGTTTTVNTETLEIEDHNLVIASNVDHTQLINDHPDGTSEYAGILWGTGDGRPSLTYQSTKGFSFEGGELGVGTTDPGALLDVRTTGTDEEIVAQFGNNNIVGGLEIKTDGNLTWGFNAKNVRNLSFDTNQTPRLFIKGDGDVGIGTTNPGYDLDVAGTGNFSSAVQAPLILQNGNTVVDQGDVGSAPNQIPLNKDLGTLAYMDAPEIEDINADTLELREIAAEMSDTAVDVFVYDTRKDSDGGAWRSRTSHTSWYNEELNTSIRGGRREFPAVAVIIAEANKVTIYDGDDPDLSMWMVFEKLGTFSFVRNNLSSVFALNGELCIGIGNAGGLSIARFVDDSGYTYFTSERRTWSSVIATRTELVYDGANDTSIVIVHNTINDVAMTVLPNAPIDSDTGLPIPTIAVATDGGVSVIKDDGSVVDSSYVNVFNRVGFKDSVLYLTRGTNIETWRVDNYEADGFTGEAYHVGSKPTSLGGQNNAHSVEGDNLEMGSANGLGRIYENKTNLNEGMIAYTTSNYNTGWMPGDIKLATLSDTKIEKVGVDESILTELVTNGGFGDGVTGWILSSSNAPTVSSGVLQFNNVDGSAQSHAEQEMATVAGKKYALSFDYVGSSTLNIYIGTSQGTSEILNRSVNSSGAYSFSFVATSSSTWIRFRDNVAGSTPTIDNISVRQTGELITNGTFDNGIEGWTLGTGWSVSGGVATHTGTSFTTIQPTTSIRLINGKKYTYTIDTTGTGNVYLYYNGDSNYHTLNGGGSFVGTFTAGGYPSIKIGTSGDGYTVDNISVRLAEDDRSVNNNGLQVFGQIDKTPVAPGADLVAYSGFSADDYLMQPYNSDLDFGTGDFCVMGWINLKSQTSNKHIFAISDGQGSTWGNNGYIACKWNGPSSRFEFNYAAGGLLMDTSFSNSGWQHFTLLRKNGVIKMYTNSNYITSATSNIKMGLTNSNSNLIVGGAYYNSNLSGHSNYYLSLFRISKTAPSPEQIAKIYRDEKALFTDGAQATLYGTSDAVTALAYDDSDDLLHVGTASGRSVFNGLKRVDNTTTAVSTAISATEGLVIEQ